MTIGEFYLLEMWKFLAIIFGDVSSPSSVDVQNPLILIGNVYNPIYEMHGIATESMGFEQIKTVYISYWNQSVCLYIYYIHISLKWVLLTFQTAYSNFEMSPLIAQLLPNESLFPEPHLGGPTQNKPVCLYFTSETDLTGRSQPHISSIHRNHSSMTAWPTYQWPTFRYISVLPELLGSPVGSWEAIMEACAESLCSFLYCNRCISKVLNAKSTHRLLPCKIYDILNLPEMV